MSTPEDQENGDQPIDDQPQVTEEFDDLVDEPQQELSLDKLTQAYAEVMQERLAGESQDHNETSDRAESNSESEVHVDSESIDASGDEEFEDEPTSPETETINLDAARARLGRDQGRERGKDPQSEDDQDNAGCDLSPDSIVEAILFVGCPPDQKLNSRKIAALLRDVSPKEVTQIVKKLNKKYKTENAPYHIESSANKIEMVLDSEDAELEMIRQKFYGEVREVKLPQNAIDVLAVVAYNQPVSREDVDKIRQKPSGSTLNQMVKRELLDIAFAENKPKKKLFQTTDRFLDLFGLESLEDLPQTSPVSDLEELAD